MSWPGTKIGEMTLVVTKGTTPTKKQGFTDSGINFVKAEALNGDSSLDTGGFYHISEEVNEKLKRSILKEDDVLVTIAGANIGECGLVKESHLPANTNQAVGIVRLDQQKALPQYIYYWFKQRHTFAFIQGLNAQAAQPNINLTMLKNIDVPLPDLGIQNNIANILSTYDDLIENNWRRIQLLEQAARLLYKEWFVHLRFPGHEHVKIIDGVPEGWEKIQVKDILLKVKRPIKIKKEDYLDDGSIPCVDQSREFIGGYTDNQEAVVDIGKPVIVFGDHTRILKFVDFPFVCGADGTQLIVSNDDAISQEYLYFALDSVDLSNYFYARHFKFLKDQYIPRPSGMLVSQFTGVVRPVMQQIKILRELIFNLSKARDLLLPRLMNEGIAV